MDGADRRWVLDGQDDDEAGREEEARRGCEIRGRREKRVVGRAIIAVSR